MRTGRSRLWHCVAGKYRAYVVTRVDLNPTQLVIVAFEGSGMAVVGPWFIERAHAQGIPVRAHCTDPRVERLLRMRLKFRRAEVVLLAEREEKQSEFRRQGQLARNDVESVQYH